MDNSGYDALDQKSVFGTTWLKKKQRYEEEEIAFSPPDESGFLALRFGPHPTKPVESMYDRINKELGLSVETQVPKANVTPDAGLSSKISDGEPAKLLLGPKGITLENFKNTISDHLFIGTHSPHDSPKLLRHPPILERSEEKETSSGNSIQGSIPNLAALSDPPEKSDRPEDSFVAQQDLETLVGKARGGRPTRKISMNLAETFDRSLLESVQELKLEAPTPTNNLTGLPSFDTSPHAFEAVPHFMASRNSTDRRRKTSAPPSLNPMLPENQKAHNFFFTGSLFSAVGNSTTSLASRDTSPTGSHVNLAAPDMATPTPIHPFGMMRGSPMRQMAPDSPSSSGGETPNLSQATSLMEDRAKEAAALEPKPRMAKRRPRASALREMNFFAPQST